MSLRKCLLCGLILLALGGSAYAHAPYRTLTFVGFTPDGKRLVTTSFYGKTRLWEVATGKELWRESESGATCLAVSPDGKYVALGCHLNARILDMTTGKEVRKIPAACEAVLAFSPDGKLLAAGSHNRRSLTVIEVATGKERWRFMLDQWIEDPAFSGVAFSRDGKLVIASVGDRVAFWDAETGARSGRVRAHNRNIDALTLSMDGTLLASASREIHLLDAETRQIVGQIKATGSLAFDPQCKTLLTGSDNELILWDIMTSKEMRRHKLKALPGSINGKPKITSVAFSPDGKWVAAGDTDARFHVLSADTLKEHFSAAAGIRGAAGMFATPWPTVAYCFQGAEHSIRACKANWLTKEDRISVPIVKDGMILAGDAGRVMTYKILPSFGKGGWPTEIDLVPVAGPDQGKVHQGIFAWNDGELRICFSPPGADRPTEFTAPAGSNRVLLVYQN